MFDELIKTIQEAVDRSVNAATEELRKEIRALKNADKVSYSIKEASEASGIPYDTLLAKCKAGKIRYSQEQKGGTIYIKREDLDRYLDEHSIELEAKTVKVKMKVTSR